MEMDVEDDLPLDPQVEVENQAVDDVPDGALDGVLQGDESQVDLAQPYRLEYLDQRGQGDDVGRRVVRFAEKGFFGEGPLGAEEPDPRRGSGSRGVRMRPRPYPGRIVNIMDEPGLLQLLADVRSGACSPDDAVHQLRRLPFADLGFAKVDHHRSLRQGLPEAVYGQGKTPEQCSADRG